ncbi:uncharacterized protein BXZ73DRAFT_98260 [Epithele typhae]|uniref:uncharacterized protein n=1 Tax=Epithele typhae TaxID=378194 RepID=UPI0020078941|nr:uncharacterized protein BXZ73DRAFT_98260 [Epithele typhae]KAH9941872.1 hypothetical protein BXZ73DRAFT_98260 [Epithele typhae]
MSSPEPLPRPVGTLLADRERSKSAYYPWNRPRTWRFSRAQPRSFLTRLFSSRQQPDTPVAAFYRIYEFFVLNWTSSMRRELEYFCCSHPDWAVAALPDPQDPDPVRAAILAVLTRLMCAAFNRRIELGVPRNAPPIVLDWEELQQRPKVYEHPPEWAKNMPPLKDRVVLPDEKGELPNDSSEDTSDEFREMNILVFAPHIHFI